MLWTHNTWWWGFLQWYVFGWARETYRLSVLSWPNDPATPRYYSLQLKCVFAHPCVKEKKLRKCQYTPPPPPPPHSPLHLFRPLRSNLSDGRRWHDAACCGNHKWILWEWSSTYDLRLSVSTSHWAPWSVKNVVALFPGLVIDAACTVEGFWS